jgi:hypothetical protein
MRISQTLPHRLAVLVLFVAATASAQNTINAPATVEAGAAFELTVTGTLESGDIITIVEKPHPETERGPLYGYFHKPPTAKLTAPDKSGTYELRYFSRKRGPNPFARRDITVEGVPASLEAPATVKAGAPIQVTWTGPGRSSDTIRLAEVGAPPKQRLAYTYPARNPATLTAPDKPGAYELRYVTGQSSIILASRPITVGGTEASLTPADEVQAGTRLDIPWEGPNNPGDVINLVPVIGGQRAAWGYPGNGNPATMTAPLKAGAYELRYQTGQSKAILARAPITVTPATAQPGKLKVVSSAAGADLAGSAIEIILDASGSMLQRLGSQRRIDIAKETLAKLTSEVIPSGTPFALRVFGKEVGSCQTDLEIPPAPLNPSAVAAKITALQAKNNAKTPIAASLSAVAEDLGSVQGERIVILITDGEETCDGDPAAAIKKLRDAGVEVRVNVVGFAIDDAGLRESFQDWADLGGGAYFDARDAAGLMPAVVGALRPTFDVIDDKGQSVADGVVDGDEVELLPGSYTIRVGTKTQPAQVEASKTATVTLE